MENNQVPTDSNTVPDAIPIDPDNEGDNIDPSTINESNPYIFSL